MKKKTHIISVQVVITQNVNKIYVQNHPSALTYFSEMIKLSKDKELIEMYNSRVQSIWAEKLR